MSRISKAFEQKKLFIGYLTVGDGDTEGHFTTLLEGGVDLLEIGVPFSDPVADGPTIQQAMERSLRKQTTLETVFHLVSRLREKSDIPMVLFTYYNPIRKHLDVTLRRAKEAGIDGVVIIDLPPEEAEEYRFLCKMYDLDPIFVIAPSTPLSRIEWIAKMGRGFLYYACRKGTTGARLGLPDDLAEKIRQIRSVSTLPIAVGFGISNPKDARDVVKVADAFVVGSYFVEEPKRVYDFRM